MENDQEIHESYQDNVKEIQQKMEMGKVQLHRANSRIGALEGELAEARSSKEKMDEVVLGLKEELEKK